MAEPPLGARLVMFSLVPPTAVERRHARLGLLAVCVGVVLMYVLGTDLSRPINWDESVHFTQVLVDGHPAVFFEPHRTRGVSLLAVPVALFDPSMFVFRLYLLVAGAVGTYLAFATWIPVIGAAAPLAAAVYSAHWVTIYYTVELLPNHPSALLSVAIAGLVARMLEGGDVRRLALISAGLVFVHGLVRPPEAVFVGLGIALVLLVARWRIAARVLPLMAAGGVMAFVPWLIEGWVRFRFGPLETMRSAGEYATGGESFNQIGAYLANLDNNLRCVGRCLDDYLASRAEGWTVILPAARTLTLVVVSVLLAALAVVAAGPRRGVVAAALAPAALLTVFYNYLGGAVNLRYIMPVLALGFIGAAIGTVAVMRAAGTWGPAIAWPVRTVVVVILVATIGWQVQHGLGRQDSPTATRVRAAAIGQALAEVAGDEPCAVLSRVNYPQVQYWTGCRGALLRDDGERLQPPLGELHSYVDAAERARRGDRIFAVVRGELADDSPMASWTRLPGEPWEDYALYEWEGESEIPDPPCPPSDGPERALARVLSEGC